MRQFQHHVALRAKAALRAAGDADQRDGKAARIGDQIGKLRRFARVRDRKHHIIASDHPQIAVACLGRVDELRGRARACQRRGDLFGDMAGFADAGDNHPPTGRDQQVDRLTKTVVQTVGQLFKRLGFGADDAAGGI